MNGFLWLTLFFAISDWIAVWRNQKRVRYLTKPATLLALTIWYTQMGGWQSPHFWFGLGLSFSLAGDVFLLLPARYFLTGLGAFLAAHLCYMIGFNQSLPVLNSIALLVVLVVILPAFFLLLNIRKRLMQHGHRNLVPAVMVYGVVISLMLLSALVSLWRPDWTGVNEYHLLRLNFLLSSLVYANFSITPAILASVGAGLFFLSDTLLVQNRFISPLPQGNLWVMIAYHLGQILLAIAAASH